SAKYHTAISRTTMPMITRIMPMLELPPESETTTVSCSCSSVIEWVSLAWIGRPDADTSSGGPAHLSPPGWPPSSPGGRLAQGRPTLQNRYRGISIGGAESAHLMHVCRRRVHEMHL